MTSRARSLHSRPFNPLQRAPIDQTLDVGVRAINALLTVGRGQRLGLFAGSGVGKSVLLGMMARYTAADVIVVGLIGERGREVKEFIEQNLGEEGLPALGRRRRTGRRQPADAPAGRGLRDLDRRIFSRPGPACPADHGFADPLRHGATRDRAGRSANRRSPAAIRHRFSRACRNWSNAPATASTGGGSITAFYTVLTEGDDQQDPIADAARAILDGHIVLSRALCRCRPLPGHRHRAIDLARHDQPDHAGTPRTACGASSSCTRATSAPAT